jgi:hypothetical protein
MVKKEVLLLQSLCERCRGITLWKHRVKKVENKEKKEE